MTLPKKASPFQYARADIDTYVDFMNDLHIDVMEGASPALGNDTGNDAPAIQTRINAVPATGGVVYLPKGTYRCTSSIVFPTDRQVRLVGAGEEQTQIHVVAGTTATPGIIHLRGAEKVSTVEMLTIAFDQPNVTTVAGMTAFVPAIYAQNCPRFQIKRVRILRAWDGIDMRGNSGGATIESLEMSAFNVGIHIDGCLDSVYIDRLHAWVFGCTANQITALSNSTTTYPINCGRMDDLHISNCLFNGGRAVRFFLGATGPTWTTMTSCTFDSSCGIIMIEGRLSMAGCSIGHGVAGKQAILIQGGTVDIGGSHVATVVADSLASIQVSGGFLSMAGCRLFTSEGVNTTCLHVSGGSVTVGGCTFPRDANLTFTSSTILQTSGRLSLVGCRTSDKGTGTGNFLTVTTDDWHIIADNAFMGWGLSLPANYVAASVYGNTLVGGTAAKQYPRGAPGGLGCRITRTTAQGIPNGTVTPIGFDSEINDVPGWHAALNNSRITVDAEGWYLLTGVIEWTANTTGSRYAHLRLNGTTDIAVQGGPVGTVSSVVLNSVTTLYYLALGDFVELAGSQTSGGTLNTISTALRSPYLSAVRVGA